MMSGKWTCWVCTHDRYLRCDNGHSDYAVFKCIFSCSLPSVTRLSKERNVSSHLGCTAQGCQSKLVLFPISVHHIYPVCVVTGKVSHHPFLLLCLWRLLHQYLVIQPFLQTPYSFFIVFCYPCIHLISTRPVQTSWRERWSCMETLHSSQTRRKRRRWSQRRLMKSSSRTKQRARRWGAERPRWWHFDMWTNKSSGVDWFILIPSFFLIWIRVKQWPNLEPPHSSGTSWGLWGWMTRILPSLPMLSTGWSTSLPWLWKTLNRWESRWQTLIT